MKIEAVLPFSHEPVVVDGEFYIENETRRLCLYVEEWAETIKQADWITFSFGVREYNRPGEQQDFKKWLSGAQ